MASCASLLSELQQERLTFEPRIPRVLRGNFEIEEGEPTTAEADADKIQKLFPNLYGANTIKLVPGGEPLTPSRPLRVGVVLSGGQAAGGTGIIAGIFDRLKRLHPGSRLFGFLDGPHGVYSNRFVEITAEMLALYRNQGGFDIIGSGRHKIETPEQFASSMSNCVSLDLDGLIVVGGDDSNTNAALLAEFFEAKGCKTCVVGCPKTIDGDLKNEMIEISFGFDTATKTYSELIYNLCIDAKSTSKYYHFVRLMGRSASHIALECALQTLPNVTLIGEEVQHKKMTLRQICNSLCDTICTRAEMGKNYGVILVPEGLIEFVPEVGKLIQQLNDIMAANQEEISAKLTPQNRMVFESLPTSIRRELLLDRDPHGNVQVSRIETEALLIRMCEEELARRTGEGTYSAKFMAQAHFFGYEGRSCLPSPFDSSYCYSLGATAAVLVQQHRTGYIAICTGLTRPVEDWSCGGQPITAMLNIEHRAGKDKPVIKKALVELDGQMFRVFESVRDHIAIYDIYRPAGPIQFEGPSADDVTFFLRYSTGGEIDPSHKNLPNEPPLLTCSSLSTELTIHREQSIPALPAVFSSFEPPFPPIPESAPSPLVIRLGPSSPPLTAAVSARLEKISRNPYLYLARAGGGGGAGVAGIGDDDLGGVGGLGVEEPIELRPLRIGVVFCGRQTPGGTNVVCGLVNFVERHGGGVVVGFLGGTLGLFEGKHVEISSLASIATFLNKGGYDILGRSIDQLRKEEQLEAAADTCRKLNLNGLVLVGGQTTIQDACVVSEYFARNEINCHVNAVNCTVDGDIKNNSIETSIGFDTATKVYSQLIGNIARDSLSAKKYYYFVRLMGRVSSHITAECALQTAPNLVLLGEEVADRQQSLLDVVKLVADAVCERASKGKNYGVILVPEGLIQHMPVFQQLINELNALFQVDQGTEFREALERMFVRHEPPSEIIIARLTPWSGALFRQLPVLQQRQLLLDRESGGSVQLSQVASERLLAHLVGEELAERKKAGKYKGSFSAICHFFGYQARCAMPSVFDSTFAYAVGHTVGGLIAAGRHGYLATVENLPLPTLRWQPVAVPLASLVEANSRGVFLQKNCGGLLSLQSAVFQRLLAQRQLWLHGDYYRNPGPVQFNGNCATLLGQSLKLEHEERAALRREMAKINHAIKAISLTNIDMKALRAAMLHLQAIHQTMDAMMN